MTGICDRSVLDFCTAEFERDHVIQTLGEPFYSEIPKDGNPLKAEPRQWGRITFSGFHLYRPDGSTESKWVGHIVGNRSDGQMCFVTIAVPESFAQLHSEDPIAYLRGKLKLALDKLNTFRDCSCGVIGYQNEHAVLSPCEIHHPSKQEASA